MDAEGSVGRQFVLYEFDTGKNLCGQLSLGEPGQPIAVCILEHLRSKISSQERQRKKAKKTAVKSETKETTNITAAKKSVSAAKADTAASVNTTGTAKTNTAVSENTPGMSKEGTAVAANAHSAAVKPVVTDEAETAETGKITATVPADTKSASEQIVSHSNEKKTRGSKGRVCKSCGTPVSDKSRFCPSCGNKITVRGFRRSRRPRSHWEKRFSIISQLISARRMLMPAAMAVPIREKGVQEEKSNTTRSRSITG